MEQRAARLDQLSRNQQQRLSSETADQRAARLDQNSHCQQQRLSSETADQRAARQDQNSHCQQQRLSSETEAERQFRQQHDAELHRQTRSVDFPIFNQPAVVRKLNKFHTDLSNTPIPTCSTCHELVPRHSLELSSECRRCARDLSSLSLYSADNNMDPGAVPSQLQVLLIAYHIIYYIICIGTITGRGNASPTCHVNLPSPSWSIWVQWTHPQLATGCNNFHQQSTTYPS